MPNILTPKDLKTMAYGQAVSLEPGSDPYWGDVRVSLPALRVMVEYAEAAALDPKVPHIHQTALSAMAKAFRTHIPALALKEA